MYYYRGKKEGKSEIKNTSASIYSIYAIILHENAREMNNVLYPFCNIKKNTIGNGRYQWGRYPPYP